MTTITEPGVYDIDADIYHADPCVEPSLSASGAWKLVNECPEKFRATNSRLNPDAEPEAKTAALNFGSAAHVLALQPERFDALCMILPDDHNGRTKEGKALIADAALSGKLVITPDEHKRLLAMAARLKQDEFACMAFSRGRPEQSLFWKDAETGVWCRCRPDWLPDEPMVIPDYKTHVSAKSAVFERHGAGFGYHLRAAHYMAAITAIYGKRPFDYLFIVQEKEPPYLVNPIIMSADAIQWGERLRRRALRTFAQCLERDEWPGYAGENPSVVGLPGYITRELEDLDKAGFFDDPKEKSNEQARRIDPVDALRAG